MENTKVEDKSSNIISSTINNNIGTIKISHKDGGIFEFIIKYDFVSNDFYDNK